MKVKECMENNVYYLNPNNTVQDCAKLMSDNHIGCVPVCNDDKKIVGLVTDRDVILRSIATDKDFKTTPISEIMTKNVWYCNWDTDVDDAQDLMCLNQIRRLPIVDNDDKIVGIVTLGDFVKNDDVDGDGVYYTFERICKYGDRNAE